MNERKSAALGVPCAIALAAVLALATRHGVTGQTYDSVTPPPPSVVIISTPPAGLSAAASPGTGAGSFVVNPGDTGTITVAGIAVTVSIASDFGGTVIAGVGSSDLGTILGLQASQGAAANGAAVNVCLADACQAVALDANGQATIGIGAPGG